MNSASIQSQPRVATPISLFVQCQILFQLLRLSVATFDLINYIYSLSTLEKTDENRMFFVRSPHHKHLGKAQHLVL